MKWHNREDGTIGTMRVLVTGGAGFIGSHTAKALARAGWQPVVLDDLSMGHEWAVKWGPLVHGNMGNRALLRKVMAEHRVEGVIHFAAHAYVGESVSEPRKYFQNNVTNTLTLLDAMMDTGVERIVFSSTCATYGLPESLPIGEDHPQLPVNPYGESKLFVERVLRAYGHAYGLRWINLRYFNAAGADPDGELGEDHDPETHLIPLVIAAALGQRPWVDVFGTDYPTPDGTAIRDFIHVTDLADAHVRALRYLSEGGDNVALNLGTGAGQSVRQVIATVERLGRCSVPVREVARRPGDPPALVADARQAQSVLGWQPRYADLDEIVGTAWDWYANVLSHHLGSGLRVREMVAGKG
jgi:UDP-arabinose 4-epimerase